MQTVQLLVVVHFLMRAVADHLLAADFFSFASSWRNAAMVAAEGSLRLLFFCRRLVLVV